MLPSCSADFPLASLPCQPGASCMGCQLEGGGLQEIPLPHPGVTQPACPITPTRIWATRLQPEGWRSWLKRGCIRPCFVDTVAAATVHRDHVAARLLHLRPSQVWADFCTRRPQLVLRFDTV